MAVYSQLVSRNLQRRYDKEIEKSWKALEKSGWLASPELRKKRLLNEHESALKMAMINFGIAPTLALRKHMPVIEAQLFQEFLVRHDIDWSALPDDNTPPPAVEPEPECEHEDADWDRWQPLLPNDPFVVEFCEPGEVVYNGVTAIDWKLRSQGVARDLTERLLIVTSKRLLLVDNDGDLLAMPWSMVTGIEDRTMGLQGLITVRVGDNWAEWSMHHKVAPVVAKKMREFWAAAPREWVPDMDFVHQMIADSKARGLDSDDADTRSEACEHESADWETVGKQERLVLVCEECGEHLDPADYEDATA